MSEILAAARYSCATTEEMARKFMGVAQLQGNAFAMNAGRFIEALGGGMSAEQIVRMRTPFQFFASFLCREDEKRWLAAIAGGDAAGAKALAPPTRAGRLFAPAYRMCPECLAEDMTAYGVGHWHVIHQIPAIIRCPRHEIALHNECGNCGIPLGEPRSHTLPGDRCSVCRCHRTSGYLPSSLSNGYRAFESLVVRALAGKAEELRPASRTLLVHRVILQRVGVAGLPAALERFLEYWGVRSTAELAHVLGCTVSDQGVLDLLQGTEVGTSRALQAAVLSFILAHADARVVEECIRSPYQAIPSEIYAAADSLKADPDLLRELCEQAVQVGYPVNAARALATGQSLNGKSRQLAAPAATKRFLATVSAEARMRCELLMTKRTRRREDTPSDIDAARATMRLCVEEAIRCGCKSRSRLKAINMGAYQWSRRHDPAWLDEKLPCLNVKGSEFGLGDRLVIRKVLLDAIHAGMRTRKRLFRAARREYAWAFKNDLPWLDEALPAKRRPSPGGLLR